MKKEELRKRFLAKRNKLSKSEIIKRGNLAKEKLFSIKEYKKADKVMFFVSFNKEIHTHSAIKKALKEKIVSVPKIIESNIIPCIIKSFSELS